MDINIFAVAGSFAIGAAFAYFSNVAYDYFKIGNLAKDNVKKLGNVLGLKVKTAALDKIKDKKLHDKIKADLNASGDAFDEGWDLGLEGTKI